MSLPDPWQITCQMCFLHSNKLRYGRWEGWLVTERVRVIINNFLNNSLRESYVTFSLRMLCHVFVTSVMFRFRYERYVTFSLRTLCHVFAKCAHHLVYPWLYFDFQKSPKSPDRRKSSDESIASSFVAQDPKKERKFSKQRSFGFGRPSQAPSEVSVNLTPDRASNANLDEMAVSWALE